ncbi:GNAT family N-acetyltransferase [Helicobacter cappadocius]|uniref:GNAT family N-acetyltransferase n=1 Tax=Helicobacter cappadocius TaxID=3063998 RepID=A0AA90TCJ4_9HELI|nr:MULTISPECIES: GNAT family N-acetyltransferase [unclassified Helicobacter]MDO7253847.1 GNAT family N-acetyltransferase [Helicobacter sp. faydin-H75]MDP2539736.1 GNAT family N-acetyltransferase [Helicobacter sp. faydin-H76]
MVHFTEAITREHLEDIHKLAQKIWQEHYSNILTDGQIQYMVSNFQSPDAMETQLKEGYQYFQILSKNEIDGREVNTLVGYFSFVQKNDSGDLSKNNSIFLSKLYIQKTSRNQGIAKSVVAYLKRIAQKSSCNSIWLTVNKQNMNSIEAYKRLGFKIYREDSVDIGRGYVMDDYYMKIEL